MGTRGRGFLAALTLEERAGLGASSLECLAGPQPGQARPCACPELRSAGNASHPLGKHWSHLTLLARPLCPPAAAWPGRTREAWGWCRAGAHTGLRAVPRQPLPVTQRSQPGRGADPPPARPPSPALGNRPQEAWPATCTGKRAEVGSCVQSGVALYAGRWKCMWGDICQCDSIPTDL